MKNLKGLPVMIDAGVMVTETAIALGAARFSVFIVFRRLLVTLKDVWDRN